MMRKHYVSPCSLLILSAGPVGPNVGSGNGGAELQPDELTPDEQEDLENGGGW